MTLTALVLPGLLLLLGLALLIQRGFTRSVRSEPSSLLIERESPGPEFVAVPRKPPVVSVELKQQTRKPRAKASRPVAIPDVFVVLDLETTGFSPVDDEIIELGALRITPATNEAAGFKRLVKPEGRIPPLVAELTGITQQMVNTEGSSLQEALSDFLDFIGDFPLVTYNAKFDMAFLQAAASRSGRTITNSYACALELARNAWPGQQSYKLVDLVESVCTEESRAVMDQLDAHRALGDCHRTVGVFLSASSIVQGRVQWTSLASSPVSRQLAQPSAAHSRRTRTPMYEHSISMRGDCEGPLHGETAVFTGSLSIPRGQASALAAKAGCDVRVNVTHRTTMLVVGLQDPQLLAGKEKSNKRLAAEALIREGQGIRILTEADFLRLIAASSTIH